jgi:hypothetical protein
MLPNCIRIEHAPFFPVINRMLSSGAKLQVLKAVIAWIMVFMMYVIVLWNGAMMIFPNGHMNELPVAFSVYMVIAAGLPIEFDSVELLKLILTRPSHIFLSLGNLSVYCNASAAAALAGD